MDYKVYALMAILMASVASVALVGAAYAQTTSLTVSTDKTSYATGDTITVSGKVTTISEIRDPLVIKVTGPTGNIVKLDQFAVGLNGTYSYKFPAGGLMNADGKYTAEVSYKGTTKQTATFDFDFTGVDTTWRTFTINVAGQSYPVQYRITGGTVQNMVPSTETSDLVVTISATADGTLTLRLPRNVIDSRDGADGRSGVDEEFAVFVDEIPGDVIEDSAAKTDTIRQVAVNFDQGTSQIDIVGTWAIPEFGAIAAIILAVAIVGIIVATARYGKFNFAPRL